MDNLQRQLDELEALQATYPADAGDGVQLSEGQQVANEQARAALARGGNAATATLSGTVRLPAGVQLLHAREPVALRFTLPAGYPSAEPPDLAVECAASRPVHERLTAAVRAAAEAAVGSESILLALAALQEAVADEEEEQQEAACAPPSRCAGAAEPSAAAAGACADDILRAVLWFHHIKSMTKRKLILQWGRELALSGFSKPGFPGVVLLEGRVGDVREHIARVRGLQWQAMQVRAEELAPCEACARQQQQQQEGSSGGGGGSTPAAPAAPGRRLLAPIAELDETGGLSVMGQACKAAGLEHLLRAALKL